MAEAVPAKPAELEPTPAAAAGSNVAAQISDAPVEAAPAGDESAIEVIKERYPNGAVKIERAMIQDAEGNYLMHGAWRQYDEQGRLIIDGRLEHNRKEGLWRRFYRGDETQLLFSPPYKDFTAPFISTATFHADVLEGTWTITDARQRKVHELQFTGGHRDGQAVWYYPSGAVMLQTQYELGSVTGEVVKYAPDGTLIAREQFQAGRKLGPKVEFHEGGQVKSRASWPRSRPAATTSGTGRSPSGTPTAKFRGRANSATTCPSARSRTGSRTGSSSSRGNTSMAGRKARGRGGTRTARRRSLANITMPSRSANGRGGLPRASCRRRPT